MRDIDSMLACFSCQYGELDGRNNRRRREFSQHTKSNHKPLSQEKMPILRNTVDLSLTKLSYFIHNLKNVCLLLIENNSTQSYNIFNRLLS